MSQLGSFIWGTADVLRGPYKANQYGNVILPMTILRRLDCVLADHQATVEPLVERFGNNPDLLAAQMQRATGLPFYNTSPWTLRSLLGDPKGLEANLKQYVNGFSDNMDVFERFKLADEISTMAEKNILYIVVERFANIDLHPNTVTNAEMGDLYEYLIRTFNESSNEAPGEHFTPRDAIRLLVDLVFAGDDAALSTPGTIRSIYDPTVGTGGMLSIAEEHLIGSNDRPGHNPQAQLRLYGQEWNDHSYAVCKSDLLIKGYDPSNIQLGDTLADDKFAGQTFDYCLSNPPYGDDWKTSHDAVVKENEELGEKSRFHAGLPTIGDAQLLFLQHIVHKMRPKSLGGGRAAIVLNASSTYGGRAGSGASEIRRHLLENDLVDAIVALPPNMFYNTEIATYVWVLDNNKPADRESKVLLIDGREMFSRMRKKLGKKSYEISDEHRSEILRIYDNYKSSEISRLIQTSDFGYVLATLRFPDEPKDGNPIFDAKGKPVLGIKRKFDIKLPISFLRENHAATINGTVRDFLERDVFPYFPYAFIEEKKAKLGYEIAFEQYFFEPELHRTPTEIDGDIRKVKGELIALIEGVTG